MRVLGISGSLRRDSHNTRVLRAAAELLPPGAELALFDGLAAVPPYDEDADVEPAPAGVRALRDAIAGADALLISTPEYNASIPGVLKNAVDWASRPFPGNVLRDKPVLVIGASTGLFGAVWAQAELRKVLKHAGAEIFEDELAVGLADDAFTADGELADPELTDRLASLVERLANVQVREHHARSRGQGDVLALRERGARVGA
jgi:chromate reductase, NAD(P)H dehydrogenase (quinone)